MTENRLLGQLNEYIEYKHSLGFKIRHEESILRNFIRFTLKNDYEGHLSREIILKWISEGNKCDKTMGRKVEAIRPFSKYVAAFDSQAEAIYGQIYKNVHDRPVPYIYSETEVVQLMNKCKSLYSPDGIRAKTIAIVLGLLWSAGLRPSEATNLKNEDVDIQHGIIHIRRTKFAKERYVPIEASTSQQLLDYKSWINQTIRIMSHKDAFFYTTGGIPLTQTSLAYAFKKIRSCIDAKPLGYPTVRLHDFRHTMACNTILRWTEQGIDINSNLHVLSTYMGHVKPQDTYWYLSATPEMLELSCSKYEQMFGGNDLEN